MLDLSVIVPVYNMGKYITKCVESLVNQKYKNVEIILVDDGPAATTVSCNHIHNQVAPDITCFSFPHIFRDMVFICSLVLFGTHFVSG